MWVTLLLALLCASFLPVWMPGSDLRLAAAPEPGWCGLGVLATWLEPASFSASALHSPV